MKAVKTLPKFKCDFCRRTSTKGAMEKHEKICWRNPNRFCDLCKNFGQYNEGEVDAPIWIPCYYCSKFKTQESEVEELKSQ